ncbi:MAG: hypothetical protein H9Q65_05570 [Spiroplasma ixodetis]|nr:hypothetical protein [Spiroplasma ixodetis]MBP1528692.1 hypothetical protein [Spiroplasma ixodetis]
MKSIVGSVIKNKIVIYAFVSAIKYKENSIEIDNTRVSNICCTLIDTGATGSVVSKKIIEELNLESVGTTDVITASDNIKRNIYNLIISIHPNPKINGKIDKENINTNSDLVNIVLPVIEGKPDNYDIVLGMDIINKGHLTICSGAFIFSI